MLYLFIWRPQGRGFSQQPNFQAGSILFGGMVICAKRKNLYPLTSSRVEVDLPDPNRNLPSVILCAVDRKESFIRILERFLICVKLHVVSLYLNRHATYRRLSIMVDVLLSIVSSIYIHHGECHK